jgi:ribosomal protein L3 glutamine methyltransferase
MSCYTTITLENRKALYNFGPDHCFRLLMLVKDYINQVTERLESAGLYFGHGTDNARDEAFYLVFASLNLSWSEFENGMQREIKNEELDLIEHRVRLRIDQRIPAAYLVGVAWFAGYPFRSDARALVPRSPIAELLENRLEPLLPAEPGHILDLCCGGGCIGIASALVFPDANIDLVDISPDALQLARENLKLHGADQRVEVVCSDLFQKLAGRRYDLIISNPPYVGDKEYTSLPAEFQHEPALGLLSEDAGLRVPLDLLKAAPDYLTEQGILILEVGHSCDALVTRCPDVPFLWLDFEHGGEGVLVLSRAELLAYQKHFE